MKKWLLYMLLLFCITGCGQKEVQTEPKLETFENVQYGNMTVDENGIIYTVETEKYNGSYNQCISVYDSNGVCLGKKRIPISMGDASRLEAGDGVLYLVVPELYCFDVLYEIDTTTWLAKRLYDFDGFNMIHKIVPVGNDVYVLGRLSRNNWPEREIIQYSEDRTYSYQGKVLLKFSGKEDKPEAEYVPIEFIEDIFVFKEDVLGVYCYTEENGFILGEYTQGKLEQKRQFMDGVYDEFRGCGEGFLYRKNGERICYGTMEEDTETDIMTSSRAFGLSALWMTYQNGFTSTGKIDLNQFCMTHKDGFFYVKEKGEKIQIVSIETILKENEPLQFLRSDWINESDIPHGCGYKMKRQIMDGDAVAQKVLEQDTNFDLYLFSSRESTSYNLKENGTFYRLNEVECVQEYLDACFPYVKEAAINEDGDIWMIPVTLAIPGVVYNKAFCEENGVDLTQMNLSEFLDFTFDIRKENVEYGGISSLILRETMFGQYMSSYDTFDTVLLRNYIEQLRDVNVRTLGSSVMRLSNQAQNNLRTGIDEIPDYYYSCILYKWSMDLYLDSVGNTTYFGVIPVPKMEEDMINRGTVTFMMVNPNSENLEDTLQYISDFAKAMLKEKDSFMLADESTYSDTPFVKDCYELYANSGIFFEIDYGVYVDILNAYLDGTIELEETIAEMERRRREYFGE